MKLTLFDGPTLYDVEQFAAVVKPIAKDEYKSVATTTGTYVLLDDYMYKHVTTKISNLAEITLSHRIENDEFVAVQQYSNNTTILYSQQITKTTYAITPELDFIVETNKVGGEAVGYYFSGNNDLLINIKDLQYKIEYVLTLIEEVVENSAAK